MNQMADSQSLESDTLSAKDQLELARKKITEMQEQIIQLDSLKLKLQSTEEDLTMAKNLERAAKEKITYLEQDL